MKQTEDILQFSVNFVTTFGYIGVAFILLAIAYYLKSSNRAVAAVCTSAGLSLVVAYAAFDILSRYFPGVLISRSNVSGVVFGAKQDETVHIEVGNEIAPRPYIRRDNDPRNANSLYFFMSFWNSDYKCITVDISSIKPEDKAIGLPVRTIDTLFSIPVNATDASSQHQLLLDLKRNGKGDVVEATLRHFDGSRPVDSGSKLKPLPISDAGCEEQTAVTAQRQRSFAIAQSAMAGTAVQNGPTDGDELVNNPKLVRELLTSTDPFVQRKTRDRIAGLGNAAIPIISDLLQQDDYQLQLGGLVALANLAQSARSIVPASVWQSVKKLQNHPDSTMREAAVLALRFEKDACGVITDNATGNAWIVGTDKNVTWSEADAWIEQLRACGKTWKMPTPAQLQTLFDVKSSSGTGWMGKGRSWPAHINPIFQIGGGSWAWASGKSDRDGDPAFNFYEGIETRIKPNNPDGFSVREFAISPRKSS